MLLACWMKFGLGSTILVTGYLLTLTRLDMPLCQEKIKAESIVSMSKNASYDR